MTITVDAIYQQGVLKPEQPLPLDENQRVEIVIHAPPSAATEHAAENATKQAALQRFLSVELPVSDWQTMEDEIIRGASE